jgi:DNA-binding NarL/FixJ family response regulator
MKDFEVVGEAENGRQALEVVQRLLPDIVIMDITMADLNGVEATRQIVNQVPGIKIIGLSMHSDSRLVTEILNAGAVGYVKKDCGFEELATAIRGAVKGGVYVCSAAAEGLAIQSTPGHEKPRLAPRESEVLQLIAEGKNTKEVALALNLSAKTVETYRKRLMDKLGFRNVAELTRYAIREGLTPLGD